MTAMEMEAALEAFAKAHGFDPPPAYFIWGEIRATTADGRELYSNEALEWCDACARKLVADAGFTPEQAEEHRVCQVSDTAEEHPCICAGCSRSLFYSLTDYGVAQEVDHFRRKRLRRLCASEAWEIARMLSADPDNAAVLRIAARAVKAAQSLPTPGLRMTTLMTDDALEMLKEDSAYGDGLLALGKDHLRSLTARLASAEAALKPIAEMANIWGDDDNYFEPVGRHMDFTDGENNDTGLAVGDFRAAADHFAKVSRKDPDHGTD